MDFGQALDLLKKGKVVRRAAWRLQDTYLIVNTSETSYPIRVLGRGLQGGISWHAMGEDLLSEDWELMTDL